MRFSLLRDDKLFSGAIFTNHTLRSSFQMGIPNLPSLLVITRSQSCMGQLIELYDRGVLVFHLKFVPSALLNSDFPGLVPGLSILLAGTGKAPRFTDYLRFLLLLKPSISGLFLP
jgi:hypothetical protein